MNYKILRLERDFTSVDNIQEVTRVSKCQFVYLRIKNTQELIVAIKISKEETVLEKKPVKFGGFKN